MTVNREIGSTNEVEGKAPFEPYMGPVDTSVGQQKLDAKSRGRVTDSMIKGLPDLVYLVLWSGSHF